MGEFDDLIPAAPSIGGGEFADLIPSRSPVPPDSISRPSSPRFNVNEGAPAPKLPTDAFDATIAAQPPETHKRVRDRDGGVWDVPLANLGAFDLAGDDATPETRMKLGARAIKVGVKPNTVEQVGGTEFGRGIPRGAAQMTEGLSGFGQLLIKLGGLDETDLFSNIDAKLNEIRNQSKAVQGTLPARVNSVRDIKSVGDAGSYVGKTLGELAPQVVASFIGGAGASAAGRAAGVSSKLAGFAGAAAISVPQESGSMYSEIMDNTGRSEPLTALLFGTPSGLLDAMSVESIFSKVFAADKEIGKLAWKQFLRETVKGVAKAAGTEGSTESVQEGLALAADKFADNNYKVLTPQNFWRVVDAGIAGAIGGGVMGAGEHTLEQAGAHVQERAEDKAFARASDQVAVQEATRGAAPWKSTLSRSQRLTGAPTTTTTGGSAEVATVPNQKLETAIAAPTPPPAETIAPKPAPPVVPPAMGDIVEWHGYVGNMTTDETGRRVIDTGSGFVELGQDDQPELRLGVTADGKIVRNGKVFEPSVGAGKPWSNAYKNGVLRIRAVDGSARFVISGKTAEFLADRLAAMEPKKQPKAKRLSEDATTDLNAPPAENVDTPVDQFVLDEQLKQDQPTKPAARTSDVVPSLSRAARLSGATPVKEGENNGRKEETKQKEVLTPQVTLPGQSDTASTGTTTVHPYELAREAEVPPKEDKTESLIDPAKYPIKRVDPKTLKLSAEVPNFKGNADMATGEVTPIEGESYDYRDTGAVQVWVRLNGDKEIISGRHRWNQALRTNSPIPVQEHFESEGFTADHARILDAELNIRDGKGEVSDYANYFRNTKQLYDEASARARGLLRGVKSRTGWHIGHNATDDLYSLWAAGKISDAKAVAIAATAPNDNNLQRFGIKSALAGADPGQIVARIESAKSTLGVRQESQGGFGDILGGDEWAKLEQQAEREGDYVAEKRNALQDIIATRTAVLRRYDVATGTGSIKANAKKAQKELDAAHSEIERWKNWATDKQLRAEIDAALGNKNAIVMAKESDTNNGQTKAKESGNGEAKLFRATIDERKPDTGTGDMFGAAVPAKAPEVLAEEKRLSDQKAGIADGQGKKLSGSVDTTMDLLGNGHGEVPLLSQNPNLPGGQKQGSIGDGSVADGEETRAVGVDAIRELLRRPELNLPTFVRRVINAMLDTPVMRNLDWSRLELVIRNQIEGGYIGSASVLENLIEMSRTADAATFPHEVFHFLFEMLPTDDRLAVDAMRREAIKAYPREGLSADAKALLDKLERGETLTSDDFAKDLPAELYPLINPSEYLAQMAGNRFADSVYSQSRLGPVHSLIERVHGFLMGIIESLKRVFGARPSLEQIYRELLAGKHDKSMLESVVTYAKQKQGAFSQDAESARNAEALAQTNEQRETEATHQLAQSHDIVESLAKHGAGSVGDASKTLLGWWEHLGIDAAGRRLNGGIGEGYRQLKARITDPFQRTWLARMAHQQWSLLDRNLREIIERRNEESDKLTKPGFLRLLAREAAAKVESNNADSTLRISQSIFHSAMTMARKAMVQEGKTDMEIASIEGELKGLDDAEKSSVAMQQLLNDMVSVISSSPHGVTLLTDPNVGTRSEIIKEYRAIKATVNQPVHNENLIRWAAYILHKSKDLRENLLATQWSKSAPIRAAMGPYETKFLADFEKDPVKTVKQNIRVQSKLATDAQKAAFAWRILNKEVTQRLDDFAVLDDASDVAGNVLADPDVKSLRSELKTDAQVIGTMDPAKPFTKNSVLLPDGSTVEIDPDKIVGSRTEFASVRAGFEAAINQLQAWLNNPSNAVDVNYRMHERNLGTIQDYFSGLSMLQPNDSLRLLNRSFEIVRNAVNIAGGRVAAQVRVALARLDHDSRGASWWTQRYTNLLAESAQKAIRSHGIKYTAFGGTSVHDANKAWYDKVGNQLAYSYNRAVGALKVGDTLASGEKVTQADIDHLRLMAEAISKGFDVLGDRQMTQDTLGGFKTFRRALKGNPLMTVRVFNDDLANFSKDFLEQRESMHEALAAGDKTKAAAAEKKMLDTLDAYFSRIGTAFTLDRNPEFSKATAFDGPGGAFEVLGRQMSQNPRLVTNMQQYFDALSSLSTATSDEAKQIILGEWGRIIETWNKEAVNTEAADMPRSEETKNSFTRSRNDAIAPYVFYENGFRNSHSVQKFGSGIQSRAMDDVVSGLDALVTDIERQQKEFSDQVARTAGTPKEAEAKVRTKRAIEKANGENYDSFDALERRKKLVQDARDLLADKSTDTDVDVTFGRYIGALTGILIGTAATARNVTSGPRYLGQLARRLNASNLRSNPMAMWHGWLNAPMRLLASLAYGVPKAALFDLPVGAGKAIAGLTDPQRRNVESVIHSLFRGVIKELGENVYNRVSEVRRMQAAGVHHVPDAVSEWDNKLLGTWLTHGLILEKDLSTVDKVLQSPVAMLETLILSFQKTLMPMFGDTGLNMATSMLMKGRAGPIQQLERTLRRVYADYKLKGYRAFDFANPQSENNVLSHQEMFPRGIKEMRVSSSERDMQNLREQFESAGLNFDEKAAEFMAQLDKGTTSAQFLTDAERDSLTNSAIDYTNRASLTNNPLNLKRKNFVNNLIKPFMFWKVRSLSNFLNDLSTSAKTDGKTTSPGQLFRQRAMQVAVASTMILLPYLFWGAMTNAGDEEANRRLKLALFNQITGFRQPWERQGASSRARGWLVHAFNGVPFIDMAMNTMFNDMPNRASFDPSLAAVEKAKDVARYIGGVAQTGDITYKLPQLIGGLFPDAKIVLSRMESQAGLREINNVAALATRHGPTELLRPSGAGSSGGVMANELTPYGDKMVNAAATGNMTEFQAVYEEAVQVARDMGRPDPEKAVAQMFKSRNPYSRALKAEMTPAQREEFLSSLSPDERARVEKVEGNLTAAAESIGTKVSFVSGDEVRSRGSQGSGASASGRASAASGSYSSRLARGGRIRSSIRRGSGRVARGRSRRGFARLSRAPRLA